MADDEAGLVVEVQSRFDSDTDRGRAAAEELRKDLERGLRLDLSDLEEPQGDFKGDPVTMGAVLLAIISSGALKEALGIVKTWIEREPEDREVRMQGEVNGNNVDVVITGKNVDDETFQKTILESVGAKTE